MRQRPTPQALFLIVSFVCLAHAHSPAREDLDIPLDAILRRQSDVLVTSSAGIFWADLERKEWHKLQLPAEMPVGGRFGSVPDGSQQILYYSTQQYKLIDGQKRGIYGSTDAGKTWQLLSENADYGPVALLPSGALFAVTNAGRSNGPAVIEVSRDLGKSWRDITGNSFGEVGRLFPDPDHPGLICLDVNTVRGYILQAEDENYDWKATRSWDWHPERVEKVAFGRPYSTHATNNPLYMLPATLHNYFEHDFGNRASIPAIDLSADKASFVFGSDRAVVIPISVRFLEDLRIRRLYWKQRLANGYPDAEPTPTVERLIDHPINLGLWGLRVEFRGERKSKRPAISAAVDRIGDEDFAARLKGAPGRRAESTQALIAGLKADPDWKSVEFSAASPYRRVLDLGKLYDFSEPGEYRVQVAYDSSWLADRTKGQWVGTFSSPVFTITVEPPN